MLKLGFTYKKSQTNWKLLIEATLSSAESNMYVKFVIANDVRPTQTAAPIPTSLEKQRACEFVVRKFERL